LGGEKETEPRFDCLTLGLSRTHGVGFSRHFKRRLKLGGHMPIL
jgi:hypothetical protein